MTTNIIFLNDEKEFTLIEKTAFEEKHLSVMQHISALVNQRKSLEEQEKQLKGQLEKVMDEYEIKSIDNQYLRITRVAPNAGKTVIDVEQLEKNEPDLFKELLEDYPKVSGKKKGYVKFDIKE